MSSIAAPAGAHRKSGWPVGDTPTTDHVTSILTRAFAQDPPCRWLLPEADLYASAFPTLVLAFGGAAFREATLVAREDGAALWLAPGSAPDEDALLALVGTRVSAARREAAFELFEEMDKHHFSGPHWYLPIVGVEPGRQGRGTGAALIAPVLETCDATGMPAYLEATTERSRRLYGRMGFRVTGEIRVADCPPIVPMLREPRPARRPAR